MAEQVDAPLRAIYWTPALPAHWVAEDATGARWLLPCNPITPEAWRRRAPYRGNYALEKAVPQAALLRLYSGGQAPEVAA